MIDDVSGLTWSVVELPCGVVGDMQSHVERPLY